MQVLEDVSLQTALDALLPVSSVLALLGHGHGLNPIHFLFSPQAGITTTLNSRCSVLAAANSVFGRWDETKGEENIDFMPTILSRFDMIFIVKDEHNEERDMVGLGHVGAAGTCGAAFFTRWGQWGFQLPDCPLLS